jgi:hypothetical protein
MIYLIITACINNKYGIKNPERRKQEYTDCITKTLSVLPKEITPIIVENNGARATYLDTFGIPVVYTNSNNVHYYHKGINELRDMIEVILKHPIQDDDMIIKITGRYHLMDDRFCRLVMEKVDTFDAFVKFFNVCTLEFMHNDCVLGLMAIRAKYLKMFATKHRFQGRSMEVEFATFVRTLPAERICEVDRLGLHCCFADDNRTLDV